MLRGEILYSLFVSRSAGVDSDDVMLVGGVDAGVDHERKKYGGRW